VYLSRKSTDLTWDEDEPCTAMAEEDSAPAAESALAPPAESEVPAVEATLPEASVVEGEYTTRTQ
jgi:hypothetical protein